MFDKLSRRAQLNCICDHAAKQRLSLDGMEDETHGGLFPLESIGVFVGTQKMTSDTGNDIQYWAQRQLAKKYYGHRKNLTPTQFDCIDWVSVHRTLHKLPWLFQIWAAKQVLGVTGTMKFLANQDGRSPLCPSCLECKETCIHIAWCPESGRSKAFHQSTETVERWLGKNKNPPRPASSASIVPPQMGIENLPCMRS
jgi:hypothetical protein